MHRNAILSILLLTGLHFSLLSCTAPRPVLTSGNTTVREKEPREEEVLRQKVVDFAQQFVGTGYRSAGKTPAGFDCSGFTGYVMGKFDIQLSASSRYQEKDGIPVKVSETLPGDLVFFRRDKNGTVFHVAIVLSNDEDGLFLIHSTSGRGVVIDNLNESSYWKAKYATARRVIKP